MNVTITIEEYQNLLAIAFAAKSAHRYSVMEGNTFDFMVENNLKMVSEEFAKSNLK